MLKQNSGNGVRKYFFHSFGLCIVLALCLASFSFAMEWKEMKSEHFIVYFPQDEAFAKDVLDRAEVYYRDIASSLGYPRYKEFWTWDSRVKIYVYPDKDSFLKATDQPAWSEGMAHYKTKKIFSYIWSSGFLDSLLPHEIAHLVFRDFIGFTGEIPLWLDEGVAQWAEAPKRKEIKKIIAESFKKNKLISLDDMMTTNIRYIRTDGAVYIRPAKSLSGDMGVLFLSGEELIKVYYMQAVSIISFLVESYGGDRFASFCRELRDGKTLVEALKSAYAPLINNLDELEIRWKESLKNASAEI